LAEMSGWTPAQLSDAKNIEKSVSWLAKAARLDRFGG